ncbi:MAG: glycosyltransferase, partial [Verrucomicrobiales bacterium]|nr:glycosyltransferase [Verrucomicrobiales bacterium]
LEFFPAVPEPRLSVVIIAHEIRVDSVRVLRRRQEDRDGRFEIVYVLNGSRAVEAEQVRPYVDTVVELTENTGASFARTVGAVFAKAPVLFFLDDDAIPERGCVAAHIDEFERFDVIAVRGAILPKTNNPLNELAKHYHLGDRRFPIHADVEGNTSYLDRTFFAVGGWDDEIVFGGGGIDLAFRLLQVDPDRRHQIYSPVPVVYHDYAANEEHLAKKHKKQTESRERLHRKHPNYDTLKHAWRSFRDKEHLVMPKVPGSRPPTNGSDAPTARPTASTTSADAGPFVTIAIPTYNRARFLEEAVRSALDQTYPRLEVLVVDDGSTDDTALLARGFGDSRVRYVAKEHTGGPDTRNRCIAEARGEFVLWLDSDDVLLADTLALYVAELRRSPGIDVLYGNLLVADEQLRVQEVWSYDDYHGWSEALLSESVIENRIPNGGTLVRRSCYERFGPYNTSFARSHDYEFWSRLAAEGEVKSIGTEVAIYRRHEESLTRLRRPADTRHEANTVKGLVSRHPLSLLFPFCYPAGRASAAGDARAWSIASLLMAKYGDNKTAVLYARRSVEAADIGRNVELLRILEVLDGANPAPQRNAARQDDEIGGLIDTAKRQYAADRVHACAKACARLSEIQPEAPETLLLSAMSLRRWGAAADAMTAYQCLIRRLCATAYAAAVSAEIPLETAAPPVSSAARTSIVRRLAERLAPVFGLGSIPEPIVADTVEFALRVADAADPATFLALHLQGQTPLFFGMLGVLEDILAAEPDPVLADALPRVRAGLAGKAPAPTSRKPGYSFCIITGGTRPEKVVRQIASIRALGLEHYEILVGGDVGHVPDDVRKVDLAQTAKAGRLGRMRNALARLATYDHLIVADDDLVFDLNFADGLKRFGEGYEVMAVRILNTDGTRFWDWACTGGLKGSVLLDYWEADPHVYVTGGICVLKTDVLDHVEWDELKGFYEREDVDFSNRLKAAGHTIRYNVFSAVTHDDDRYSRVGRCVYRFDHLLGDILPNQAGRPGAETTEMLLEARRMAGSAPERIAAVADVARRLGVHLPAATPHRPAPTPEPVTPTSRADATAPAPAAPLSTTAPADPTRSSEATTTRVESTTVDWIGTFLDHGSLSHVNREFTEALQSRPGMLVRRVAKAPPLSKGST